MKLLRRTLAALAIAAMLAAPAHADTASWGASATLNVGAGATQVATGKSLLACVSIITAGTTAGSVNDAGSTGAIATSNAILTIPANQVAGTLYCPNWPVFSGIAVSVGTGGVVAISYGRQ